MQTVSVGPNVQTLYSTLEVIFNIMRSINPHFTYLLTTFDTHNMHKNMWKLSKYVLKFEE